MGFNNLDQKQAFRTALAKFLASLEKIDTNTMLENKTELWFSILLKFKKYTLEIIEAEKKE